MHGYESADGAVKRFYYEDRNEIDTNYILTLQSLFSAEQKFSAAHYIPTNMAPSRSESKVASQILTQTFSYWLDNSRHIYKSINQTLETLEEGLKSETQMVSKTGQRHSVKMVLNAARGVAAIVYKGKVSAKMEYAAIDSRAKFQVSKTLASGFEWGLEHSIVQTDSRQQFTITYRF